MELDDEMLRLIKVEKKKRKESIKAELHQAFPEIDSRKLYKIFERSVSISQSNKTRNGSFLEETVAKFLKDNNVPFKEQVTIDKQGTIVGFGQKRDKCHHIVDFVIALKACAS